MSEVSLSDVVGGLPPESARRGRRGKDRRRRTRRRRTWTLVLASLLVLGVGCGGAYVALKPLIASWTAPDDYTGPGTGSVQVRIGDGASGMTIGQLLQQQDVVLSVKAFTRAVAADPDGGSIQPGTYRVRRQMSGAAAVTALLDPANRLVSKVTIPEGSRLDEIVELIAKNTSITALELREALKNPDVLGLPASAGHRPEGWLFPATYPVEPDTTATELLSSMVHKTTGLLTDLGVRPNLWNSVIIKASLVEAEGKNAPDKPKIARVLQNRLDRGMKLQLDTTVHYATKAFRIGTTIAETKVNSPYNTYLVPGLPVGAINNPGEKAIEAVLAPTPGPWLYFVATNPSTGFTEYATTSAEFAALKAKSDAWTAAHPHS